MSEEPWSAFSESSGYRTKDELFDRVFAEDKGPKLRFGSPNEQTKDGHVLTEAEGNGGSTERSVFGYFDGNPNNIIEPLAIRSRKQPKGTGKRERQFNRTRTRKRAVEEL